MGKAFCRHCVNYKHHQCGRRLALKDETRGTSKENDEQRRRRFRSGEAQPQRAQRRQPAQVLATCMGKMIKITEKIEEDQAIVAAGENSYDERDREAGRQAAQRLKDTGNDSYRNNYASLYHKCLEANGELLDKGYPVQYVLPEVDDAYAMSAAELKLSLIHI